MKTLIIAVGVLALCAISYAEGERQTYRTIIHGVNLIGDCRIQTYDDDPSLIDEVNGEYSDAPCVITQNKNAGWVSLRDEHINGGGHE